MSTHLAVPAHVRIDVELVPLPIEVDVRLTPASTDGAVWAAQLVSLRAKALFQADEIVVCGSMRSWLLEHEVESCLVVD